MSKGIVIGEQCHVINAFAPLDINGAARVSDVWSMENYSHATIIVQLGVTGAATTITVEECDDFDPTNDTAIAFSYYMEVTAGGDTLSTRTAATTTGITQIVKTARYAGKIQRALRRSAESAHSTTPI